MKKAILITIVLLLLPSFASAEFDYSKFDSFLYVKTEKLQRLSFNFALAAAKQKSREYQRKYNKIAILKLYLENLETYVQLRPMIASDKMDEFEDRLLIKMDSTLGVFNREVSSNVANQELQEIVQGLNYFKQQLQET